MIEHMHFFVFFDQFSLHNHKYSIWFWNSIYNTSHSCFLDIIIFLCSVNKSFSGVLLFFYFEKRQESWFVHGLNCFLTCESAGYALPKFTQLSVNSYYAASSASHYGISLLTRKIEEAHNSRTLQEKLRWVSLGVQAWVFFSLL